MAKPKPGDLLTYKADIERTGVVLDAAQIRRPAGDAYERRRYGEWINVPGHAWWVHREDGTFDIVKIVLSGAGKGATTWLGHFTAGGARLDDVARAAESA